MSAVHRIPAAHVARTPAARGPVYGEDRELVFWSWTSAIAALESLTVPGLAKARGSAAVPLTDCGSDRHPAGSRVAPVVLRSDRPGGVGSPAPAGSARTSSTCDLRPATCDPRSFKAGHGAVPLAAVGFSNPSGASLVNSLVARRRPLTLPLFLGLPQFAPHLKFHDR